MSFSRVAMIKNNKVDNVIILDPEKLEETIELLKKDFTDVEFVPCDDFEDVTFSNVSVGWEYINGQFVTPELGTPPTEAQIAEALAMVERDRANGDYFVGQQDPESQVGDN
jgi:hypothetical protein